MSLRKGAFQNHTFICWNSDDHENRVKTTTKDEEGSLFFVAIKIVEQAKTKGWQADLLGSVIFIIFVVGEEFYVDPHNLLPYFKQAAAHLPL